MKVYLDDIRNTPEGWIRVYTVQETIALVKTNKVTDLSLDNDLGFDGPEHEGYQVIRWLEMVCNPHPMNDDYDKNQKIPNLFVHSDNLSAKQDMNAGIKRLNEWKNVQ